jgi:hypothetical protein
MDLVVCRIQPSIHAAYQDNREEIETSIASVSAQIISPLNSHAFSRLFWRHFPW